MKWLQKEIILPSKTRGFHLVTDFIKSEIPEIRSFEVGVMHVFIKHTSASLTINENADPTVRMDFENHMNKLVPEDMPYYLHTDEGPDDMPAHIKASLMGHSVQVPISHGQLNLGIWQGIYLCEHRDRASGRTIVVTINGK